MAKRKNNNKEIMIITDWLDADNGDLGDYLSACYEHSKKVETKRNTHFKNMWKLYLARQKHEDTEWTNEIIVGGQEEAIKLFLILSKVSTFVSMMTDNKPKIFIRPDDTVIDDERYVTASRQFEARIEQLWDKGDWQVKYGKSQTDLAVQGTGCEKVYWDSTKDGSIGDIVVVDIDISKLRIDPYISEIKDAKYVIEEELIEVSEIAIKYKLKEDELFDLPIENEFDTINKGQDESYEIPNKYRPRVMLLCCWAKMYDKATESYKWRYTKMLKNKKILEDKELEYSRHPYFFFNGFEKKGLYKIGIAEIAKSLQTIFTQYLKDIGEDIASIGRSKILYPKQGDNTAMNDFSGASGEKIPCDNPERIRFLGGQPVGQDRFTVMQLVDRLADDYTGVQKIAEGMPSPNARSNVLLQGLLEGTLKKIKLINRFGVFPTLKEMGFYFIELFLIHYTEGKEVMIGKEKQTMDLKKLENKFNVEIGPNSTLPVDKEGRSMLIGQIIQNTVGLAQNIPEVRGMIMELIKELFDIYGMGHTWQKIEDELKAKMKKMEELQGQQKGNQLPQGGNAPIQPLQIGMPPGVPA